MNYIFKTIEFKTLDHETPRVVAVGIPIVPIEVKDSSIGTIVVVTTTDEPTVGIVREVGVVILWSNPISN